MVLIGLTGGIGSGKSTVAGMLAGLGAVVIDADEVAREVATPNGSAYQALVDHFGGSFVRSDGTLDRGAIADRVFSDPSELAVLNAITHSAIAEIICVRLAEHACTDSVVVLDIPLLDEEGRKRYGMDGVLVVEAPIEVAMARLVEKRGLREEDVRARIRAQIEGEERRRFADVVIDNTGSIEALVDSAERAWAWIASLRSR